MITSHYTLAAEAILVTNGKIHRDDLRDLLGASPGKSTLILRELDREQPGLLRYSTRERAWFKAGKAKNFNDPLKAKIYLAACEKVFHYQAP